MKNYLSILSILFLAVIDVMAQENLLRPIHVGNAEIKTWGFTQLNSNNLNTNNENPAEVRINILRGYGDMTYGSFFARVELQAVNGGPFLDKNWLNQIYIQYTRQGFSYRLGRMFSSALKVTNPPFKQESMVMCKHFWHFSLSLRNVHIYGKNNTRREVEMA